MTAQQIRLAITLFRQDLVNPKSAWVAPSYAQAEIARLENELMKSTWNPK